MRQTLPLISVGWCVCRDATASTGSLCHRNMSVRVTQMDGYRYPDRRPYAAGSTGKYSRRWRTTTICFSLCFGPVVGCLHRRPGTGSKGCGNSAVLLAGQQPTIRFSCLTGMVPPGLWPGPERHARLGWRPPIPV